MAPTAERSGQMSFGDYEELLSLETSIIRTLCLTVNATGSEVKYKIMDTLSDEDFYFPVNRAIFGALIEMHRRGDYVVYTNMEEEIRKMSVDIPEDLFLEDFFRGDLPELPEVGKWVNRLKERSKRKIAPGDRVVAKEKESIPPAAPASSKPANTSSREETKSTQVRSKIETRKLISQAKANSEISNKAEVRKKAVSATANKDSKPRQLSSESVPEKPARTGSNLLSSEGDEWADYLEDLASKQGKSVETGFVGLDDNAGGLSTGLLLFVDGDRDRRCSFLKQLTDQVAARSKAPGLYVSFEIPKAALRIRTLARLSGVPGKDIEKGRFKKDSPQWENVERNGRKAAAWLKRVFVVEAQSDTDIGSIHKMGRQLGGRGEGSAGVIVIDSLERLVEAQGSVPAALFAKLRALAESLDVLVIAATANNKLLSAAEVDYTAWMTEDTGEMAKLELTSPKETQSTTVRFEYEPGMHRFTEQLGI